MLVARSATRSRFRLTSSSSSEGVMFRALSIMCVSKLRNTESCSASTASSDLQTSRPSAPSPRMNASIAWLSITRERRAMSSISGAGVRRPPKSTSRTADCAMFTA